MNRQDAPCKSIPLGFLSHSFLSLTPDQSGKCGHYLQDPHGVEPSLQEEGSILEDQRGMTGLFGCAAPHVDPNL